MIKHIVAFKLKEIAEGKSKSENAAIIKEKLLSLKNLPMLKKLEVELNSPKADATNYEVVLITEFKTFDDLNAYQVHPDHKKVGEYIGKVRESRACIDFEF
jgi:hypothetical protein